MSRVRRLDSSQAYYSVKSALRSIFEVLFMSLAQCSRWVKMYSTSNPEANNERLPVALGTPHYKGLESPHCYSLYFLQDISSANVYNYFMDKETAYWYYGLDQSLCNVFDDHQRIPINFCCFTLEPILKNTTCTTVLQFIQITVNWNADPICFNRKADPLLYETFTRSMLLLFILLQLLLCSFPLSILW